MALVQRIISLVMNILLLVLYSFLLINIFYLLAKICDEYFVGSLEIISKKLKLPSDVAGATFMAVGSSAPELFTAIMALVIPGGHEQIGAGTIVGSAIFNILVIIGASAVAATSILSWQPVLRDTLFYILSILILLFTFHDGVISFIEAFIFIFVYIVYVFIVFNWQRILPYKDFDPIKEVEIELEREELNKKNFLGEITFYINKFLCLVIPNPSKTPEKYIITFLLSIFFIGILSWGLVESAVQIAHILNISDSIIALTILAGGTSIPDLLSSVIVAKKGKGGMAISNAVGSNIFDILIGLGAPWLVFTLFYGNVYVSTENLVSSIILLFMTVFAVIFLMVFYRWKMSKKAGYILIFVYICYLIYIVYITIYPEIVFNLEYLKASFQNIF